MKTILTVAKDLLVQGIREDSIVADFTMGNGNDTLFLSSLVPKGHVYAFDIQPQALENTQKRLKEHGAPENVSLILDSHHNLERYIPGGIDAGMFNLGYLPHGDPSLTTRRETSLPAVQKAVERLNPRGVVVVVVYPGHEEGRLEGEALQEMAKGFDPEVYDATVFRIVNIPHCPYVVAVERRR
ncbi:MAG: methyltransferase domain-containing protein [Oscillospiraceae bacterium]|jgi:methylase of polypeptide subunit release factors|nr:methyltransferase domain-containing protein [Oscillospiraceae bacterium]